MPLTRRLSDYQPAGYYSLLRVVCQPTPPSSTFPGDSLCSHSLLADLVFLFPFFAVFRYCPVRARVHGFSTAAARRRSPERHEPRFHALTFYRETLRSDSRESPHAEMVIASLRSSEAPAKRGCDRSRLGFLERGVIDKVSLLRRSSPVIVVCAGFCVIVGCV